MVAHRPDLRHPAAYGPDYEMLPQPKGTLTLELESLTLKEGTTVAKEMDAKFIDKSAEFPMWPSIVSKLSFCSYITMAQLYLNLYSLLLRRISTA